MTSGDDPVVNLPVTLGMIRDAASQGAGFVLTPEVTNCLSGSRKQQNLVLQHEADDITLAAACLGLKLQNQVSAALMDAHIKGLCPVLQHHLEEPQRAVGLRQFPQAAADPGKGIGHDKFADRSPDGAGSIHAQDVLEIVRGMLHQPVRRNGNQRAVRLHPAQLVDRFTVAIGQCGGGDCLFQSHCTGPFFDKPFARRANGAVLYVLLYIRS